MGLNDLMTEIRLDQNSFHGDEPMESKVLLMVLSLVEDKISEVKNQAVKWCVVVTLLHWLNSSGAPNSKSGSIDQDPPAIADGTCGGQTHRFLKWQG